MSAIARAVDRELPQAQALLAESDRWGADRRAGWREERLDEQIRAAARTPFWRERIDPGASIADVPLLDRETLQQEGERMLSGTSSPYLWARSSGSTGRPVAVALGPRQIAIAAAARLRQQAWFGLPAADVATASLGGRMGPDDPPVERVRDEPPTFRISTFRLDASTVGEVHSTILEAGGVRLLGGNTSMFELWAGACVTAGVDGTALGAELAIVGSEMTSASQRSAIERQFGCPTGEMYGAHETPMLATECAHGSLHVNEEVVWLELLRRDGSPAPPGQLGEVVVSLLHNDELPLLRYRLGDAAAWSEEPCACGRGLGSLDVRLGHLEEMALTRDGRLVHPRFLRTTFEESFEGRLRAFHGVQHGPGRFVVYVDLDGPPPESTAELIRQRVAEYLREPVELEIVRDPEQARAVVGSGKRRAFSRHWDPPAVAV